MIIGSSCYEYRSDYDNAIKVMPIIIMPMIMVIKIMMKLKVKIMMMIMRGMMGEIMVMVM